MKELTQIFNKHRSILAVYLFGSRSNGRIGPLSDYDFGVLLSKKAPDNIKEKMMSELIHALKNNNVDVVILNEVSLLLRYEVLKNGELIYEKNKAKRASLVYKTLNKYLDWSYFEKIFAKSLIKKTATEGVLNV